MEFTSELIQDGDDLAIIIPPEVMEILGVKVGDEVSFSVKDGRLFISRASDTEKVIENTDIGI